MEGQQRVNLAGLIEEKSVRPRSIDRSAEIVSLRDEIFFVLFQLLENLHLFVQEDRIVLLTNLLELLRNFTMNFSKFVSNRC